jgi:hypothetical protein
MSSSLAIVLAGVIGIEYGGGVTSSRIGLVNKTLAGSLSGVSKGKVMVDELSILVFVDGRDESGNEEDCTSSWDSGSLKLALTGVSEGQGCPPKVFVSMSSWSSTSLSSNGGTSFSRSVSGITSRMDTVGGPGVMIESGPARLSCWRGE